MWDELEIINFGMGEDLGIKELAQLIGEVVGFSGQLVFDSVYHDGNPRKLQEISRLKNLGWQATTPWFLESPWAAKNPATSP